MANTKIHLLALVIFAFIQGTLCQAPCNIINIDCVRRISHLLYSEYNSLKNDTHQTKSYGVSRDELIQIELTALQKRAEKVLQQLESAGIYITSNYLWIKFWVEEMLNNNIKYILQTVLKRSLETIHVKLQFLIDSTTNYQSTVAGNISHFSNEVLLPNSPILSDRIDDINEFFLTLTHFQSNNNHNKCGNKYPVSQIVYEFHKTFVLSEISRLFIILYCQEFRRIFGFGMAGLNITHFNIEMMKRISYYYTAKSFQGSLDRVYRHCEPTDQREVKQNVRTMGSLFQIILYKETETDSQNCAGTCDSFVKRNRTVKSKCYDKRTKNYSCLDSEYCPGKVYNCQTMSSSITVCRGTKSRYNWFQSNTDQMHYGPVYNEECTHIFYETIHEKYRPQCDICHCICVNNGPSLVHYSEPDEVHSCPSTNNSSIYKISLEPVLSLSSQKWVITGVTLETKSTELRFQIQQHQLAENWVVDSYETLNADFILSNEYLAMLEKNYALLGDTERRYVVISEEEYNAINLDDVIVADDRVITGVKFGISHKSEKPRRIELQVQSMVYNPVTGQLDLNSVQWTSSPFKNDKEVRLDDEELDIPTRVLEPNTILSKSGEFVKFQLSSLKKDAGQSVVPFIEHKFFNKFFYSPLNGIGLYHKRSKNNAGYLALRFFTPNFYNY